MSTNRAVNRTPQPCNHKVANHQHGTRACYVLDKCRCYPCSKANRDAAKERTRLKAYGRYDKYVDADPVRAHIKALSWAGIGLKTVVVRAGVSSGAMTKIVYGVRNTHGDLTRPPCRRVHRSTAERILALDPTDPTLPASCAKIPAHGVVLRMRALVALGWSQQKLANRLGTTRQNFHLATGTHQITGKTAAAARALYEELSMTLPPTETAGEKGSVTRAKQYAAGRGWLPPLALDDDCLDDPAYEPVVVIARRSSTDIDAAVVERVLAGDVVPTTNAERYEIRRRWVSSGRSVSSLETLTGWKVERYAS